MLFVHLVDASLHKAIHALHEELIKAGARVEEAEFPSGDERVDKILAAAGSYKSTSDKANK